MCIIQIAYSICTYNVCACHLLISVFLLAVMHLLLVLSSIRTHMMHVYLYVATACPHRTGGYERGRDPACGRGYETATTVFLLTIPEMPIETLDKFHSSGWSLEVLKAILSFCSSKSRPWDLQYENGRTACGRSPVGKGIDPFAACGRTHLCAPCS